MKNRGNVLLIVLISLAALNVVLLALLLTSPWVRNWISQNVNNSNRTPAQYSLVLSVDTMMAQRLAPIGAGTTPDLEKADFTEPQYGIEMVYAEGGTFAMGCTPEQESDCGDREKPAREVILSDFFIGKYEVTQAQWTAVMGEDNNPSEFVGDYLPVTNVSWYDAQVFIIKLSMKTGKNYRLPTDAEWEYAARGGIQSRGYKYSGSDDVNEAAWYAENSGNTTHRAGTKMANELGIYDMSGNAWEWTSDLTVNHIYPYSDDVLVNPQYPAGNFPIIRGGGWNLHDASASRPSYSSRVSFRTTNVPLWRSNRLGFRLAHSSRQTEQSVSAY